jgi:hypothetical protein
MGTWLGYANVSCFMQWQAASKTAAITFGVQSGTKSAGEVVDAVVTALGDTNGLKKLIDGEVTVRRIRASRGIAGPDDEVEDRAVAIPFAATGTALPANVSVLVHKRTSLAGRQGRGRLFLPWAVIGSNVNELGVINTVAANASQGYVTAFFAALVTGGVPMYLLHKAAGGPDFDVEPTRVTSLVLDPLVSTQRRRLNR